MTLEFLLERLDKLKVSKPGGRRALHKPLLLLLALAKARHGENRLQPFTEIEGKLKELLTRFGPPGPKYEAKHPFLRLRNDKLWEVPDLPQMSSKEIDEITCDELRSRNIKGGFPLDLYDALRNEEACLCCAARFLLEKEFPQSRYHRELLDAVGFGDLDAPYLAAVSGKPDRLEVDFENPGAAWQVADAANAWQRDPKFRDMVINAYEHRCAVCNYEVRIGDQLLGLESAHIRSPSRGGPDEVPNGLALCTLHHTALDSGGISVGDDMKVLVSPQLHGHDAAQVWFLEYAGKKIRDPRDKRNRPKPEYLDWHRREVFKDTLD